MRFFPLVAVALMTLPFSCHKQPKPDPVQPDQEPQIVEPDGNSEGEETVPRVGPNPEAQPVETAPPNVPEFKPAFEGQTRAQAVHTQTEFRVSTVAGPFQYPWAVDFLPDGRLLVTEKYEGRLLLVAADGKSSTEVKGVPRVDGRDQGGLLDVALSPTFKTDKLVYLSYYEPRDGGNGLAVARAQLGTGGVPALTMLQVIFRMRPSLDCSKHAGGRIAFSPDGALFVTLGDRSIL